MGHVIEIHRKLHETNVKRITTRIIDTFETTASATDIADRISHPLPGLNNWFIIKFIINRLFPSPSLCHVVDAEYIELAVIRKLLDSIQHSAVKARQTHNKY